MMKKFLQIALILSCTAPMVASTAGYRQDGSGIYAQQNPPSEWSAGTNIIWKTKMPSWANGSPIIVGDKVFTTSEPNSLVCLDRATGAILWERANEAEEVISTQMKADEAASAAKREALQDEIGTLRRERRQIRRSSRQNPQDEGLRARLTEVDAKLAKLEAKVGELPNYSQANTNRANGYCSQTPTSDGSHVYAVFGTGITVCYTLEGDRVWGRFVEQPNDGRGQGASPVLVDGKVLVHYDKLHALDAATGETVWVADEARATFGTPVIATVGDTLVAVTSGGAIVRIDDGTILASGLFNFKFASIVVVDDIIYGVDQGKAAAVRMKPVGAGVATERLWDKNDVSGGSGRNYGAPVVHGGIMYTCTDGSWFSALDAATGKVLYEGDLRLGGTVYSVVMAGDRLFVCCDSGKIQVLRTGPTLDKIALNELEEFRGLPDFHDSKLYLRGLKNLYCIGAE